MILSEQDIAEISLSAVTVKDAVADARAVEAALLAKLASAELPEPALPTHAKGPMFTADQLHASLQSSRVAFEQVCKHRDKLQAKLDELQRQEPVAYTTTEELEFLKDKRPSSAMLFNFTEPDQKFVALYAAPKALEPVALEDEMLDAAISWCDSNGINVLEPEQLSSLVNSLYITVCDAAIAAPKALEPLTDDRIGELQVEHLYLSDDGYSIRGQWEFARAIEASHGITKGTP